jgi:hypothetical protein
MTSTDAPVVSKPFRGVGLPPPDTPGGLAFLGAIVLGAVYLLLLVGSYPALSAIAIWVVSLNLILAVVASFLLVSMIGSDRSRAVAFELEFARTVQAHLAAGETLVEASPLGGILSEYARAASEQRRGAREHGYSASIALFSTALALVATLLVGLSGAMGGVPNVVGLGLLFEFGAFFLLTLTAGALVFSVGREGEVVGFDSVILRRWAQVWRPSFPFTHALTEVPWAAVLPMDTPPPPWRELASRVPTPP